MQIVVSFLFFFIFTIFPPWGRWSLQSRWKRGCMLLKTVPYFTLGDDLGEVDDDM